MKKLNKVVMVLAKFFEIAHWIIAVGGALLLITTLLCPEETMNIYVSNSNMGFHDMNIGNLSIIYDLKKGDLPASVVTTFFIAEIPIGILGAMISRNIYLICKTTKSVSLDNGETIFQKDITRMVREIGIFLISSNLIGWIVGIVAKIVLGTDALEISMGLQTLFIGLVIVYLSYVFNYGNKLQDEVDGLL